jgi:hypothetical protein
MDSSDIESLLSDALSCSSESDCDYEVTFEQVEISGGCGRACAPAAPRRPRRTAPRVPAHINHLFETIKAGTAEPPASFMHVVYEGGYVVDVHRHMPYFWAVDVSRVDASNHVDAGLKVYQTGYGDRVIRDAAGSGWSMRADDVRCFGDLVRRIAMGTYTRLPDGILYGFLSPAGTRGFTPYMRRDDAIEAFCLVRDGVITTCNVCRHERSADDGGCWGLDCGTPIDVSGARLAYIP